jgi:hypothetical protein
MFKRSIHHNLLKRFHERRCFIQVLAGPRQVGKTTLARQLIKDLPMAAHYASADEPSLKDRNWIEQQWEIGRLLATAKGRKKEALLILDEVQKVSQWSEVVKRLWDEDSASGLPLKVLLLGSAQLLIQKGLTESLSGRFEIIPATHWNFKEMQKAFGWNLNQYIYFGGYPGSAGLISDEDRWSRYILDSLIETTVSRDILLMARVDKPALLRRLFQLGCDYSGQVLAYQKMIGQLQDAGNTTTLAHYLDLLDGAGLLTGLRKFSGQRVRQRASSPKLQVYNTALMTATSHLSFKDAQQKRNDWGRLVESCVGAYLVNETRGKNLEVFYWLDRNREVDFVLRAGPALVAIEVKSSRKKQNLPGIEAFQKTFRVKRQLLVGGQGIPLEEFLSTPLEMWMG